MHTEEEYYIYKRRFNNSFHEIIENKINRIKGGVQIVLSKYKLTSRFLDRYEVFTVKDKKWNDKYSLVREFNLSKNEPFICKDILLKEINYFEAIEIDDFHKYQKKIISKFAKNQRFLSTKGQNDLKQTLSQIKEKFDSVSWGNLFSLNYSKKQTELNDLISFITVSYIKTNESYFILKINVTPSSKFINLFEKIVTSKDVTLSVPHYNSFINILQTRRFISYESFINSTKCKNIEDLLSDLNQQVKQNLTKHLKGYFHNSKSTKILPSIEYYEVGNIEDFHKDKNLKSNFETGFDGHYSLVDNEIEIYLSNSSRKEQTLIQIVKQKGHGGKEKSGKDVTDYDHLETHFLLRSLAFPCVFKGILKEQFLTLNKLKRRIYDFVNDSNNANIFKRLFFFHYNKRYIKLKQDLTQILLTTKRFESEFTKQNIYLYTRDYSLHLFQPKNREVEKDEKNLLLRIIEDFSYQIKNLDNKTKSTNEIFKIIEELNSYRTNFILQIISIFIAVLAFIFTFDKTTDFVGAIFNYILGKK